jgi:uracil-DNA glycosylase
MLAEAGYPRDQVFCTNVFASQPPQNEVWRFFYTKQSGVPKWKGLQPTEWARSELERLYQQLKAVGPKIVIAAGNYALWALTEEGLVSFSSESTGDGATVIAPTGITSWRGSMLESSVLGASRPKLKVLPIIHPAAILRAWYQRAVTIHDLSNRIPLGLSGDWRPTPSPTIISRPSYAEADRILGNWLIHCASGNLLNLSHDIETSRGTITCMAFADGPYRPGSTALVLPLVRPGVGRSFENFWTPAEELSLVRTTRLLLSHPNVRIIGQNYNYDTQWIERDWGIQPRLHFDTMLAHHLLWPGTPKGLDYLASLYNHYYWYWKDDNKEWEVRADGWEAHLRYNAEDALRTYECAAELDSQISAQGFAELWATEKAKNQMALEMMRRGIRIDRARRAEMGFHLAHERERINQWLLKLIPQEYLTSSEWCPKTSRLTWTSSASQQKDLFFRILGFPSKKSRKTGNESLDAESLERLRKEIPWASRIWDALELQRSISVFKNTFIDAELEPDGRMKCSFNTAGTETFRWSSSANAFWRGTNLQNIPKGEERD